MMEAVRARRAKRPSWMDGRIEPLPTRGPRIRGFAESVLVLVARTVCVVAGVAAMGVGLIGWLSGTDLGPWGTAVGAVLLLLGLPWSWVSVAFVGSLVAAWLIVG